MKSNAPLQRITQADVNERLIIVWDWPTRIGHWLLAYCFGLAYLTAESESWRLLHVLSGSAVLGIVSYRILWGFIGSRYAVFSNFVKSPGHVLSYLRSYLPSNPAMPPRHIGHNPAGGWSVLVLLLGAGLAAATGLLAYHQSGIANIGGIHEWVAEGALVMVGVHLLGVLVSSLANQENLLTAMFTGKKFGRIGQGIASTHIRAAVVMVVWTAAITLLFR
jgi:cytochrome b